MEDVSTIQFHIPRMIFLLAIIRRKYWDIWKKDSHDEKNSYDFHFIIPQLKEEELSVEPLIL